MARNQRAQTVLLLAAASIGLIGCGDRSSGYEAAREEPQNLIWIVVDTLRADALSCYGGPASTPNIDRLAEQGTRFEWAFSHYPMTAPSHLSMFTGLLPSQHHLTDNTLVVDDSFEMIAEKMSDAGFSTGAVVSLGGLKPKFGFAQGFQEFDAEFTRQWFRPGNEVTDAAIDLVTELSGRGRFFLLVHYSDPHEPYTPPGLAYPEISISLNGEEVGTVLANGLAEPVELELLPGDNEVAFRLSRSSTQRKYVFQQLAHGPKNVDVIVGTGWDTPAGEWVEGALFSSLPATVRFVSHSEATKKYPLKIFVFEDLTVDEIRHRYFKEVEYVDREIGRLIEELERIQVLDDSLVVFTSDHGEGIGDHDLIGHVHQLYDSLIHVPLIIRGPGVLRGILDDSFVFHVDLFPTLAGIFRFESNAELTGHKLIPVVSAGGRGIEPRRMAMTVSPPATASLVCVLKDPKKMIVELGSGRREIFDVRADPDELFPMSQDDDELLQALNLQLSKWLSDSGSQLARAPLSDEEIEQLRALGYVHD